MRLITERVGSIAQAKEETWAYRTPVQDKAVNHVVCSLDGAQVLTVNDGWREAMVGTISLVDCARRASAHHLLWSRARAW